MKVTKRLMLTVLIAVLAVSLAACGNSGGNNAGSSGGNNGSSTPAPSGGNSGGGSGGGEEITLRVSWWGSQDRADRTMKAIALFEAENPGVKVLPEFLGWDSYWEKIATQAAGKNLPDVMQMDDAYLPDYSARGLLLDLNPYVESGALDLSDVEDTFVGPGIVDGKLYAVNLGANAVGLAYDPAMFEAAGVAEPQPGYTWDDFVEMGRQIQEKLGDGVYGTPLSMGPDELKQYLMQRGGFIYNATGDALGYDDDAIMAEWFEFWNGLRKEGLAPSPEVMQSIGGLEDVLIVHQKSPFHFLYSNQLVALSKAANRPLKMIEYPAYPGGEKPQYVRSSQHMSVTSETKHPELAAKFISFITNSLEANESLGAERGIPIAGKVREHLIPLLDPAAKVSFDYVDHVGQNYPALSHKDSDKAGEIAEILYKSIVDKVSYDVLTPEEAAKEFRVEAEKIFAK